MKAIRMTRTQQISGLYDRFLEQQFFLNKFVRNVVSHKYILELSFAGTVLSIAHHWQRTKEGSTKLALLIALHPFLEKKIRGFTIYLLVRLVETFTGQNR